MAVSTLGADLINAADNLSGGLLDELGVARPGNEFNIASGSAPNSATRNYGEANQNGTIGPDMWYTEGQRWHKIYGYRFSIAYLPNDVASPDIDSALSGIILLSAAEAVAGNAAARAAAGPNGVSTAAATAAGLGVGALASAGLSLARTAAASIGLQDELDEAIASSISANETPVRWRHFTLPIPPSQMVTKPIIASKVTPTLGGVVEETSQVKMWLLSMGGTTGTSPSRFLEDRIKREKIATRFRDVIETTGLFNSASAQFQQFVGERGSTFSTRIEKPPKGAVNTDNVPPVFFNTSGIDGSSNGFTESQELQKFFFMYNALKSRYPKNYALIFSNLKTDQSWRCVVRDFQLQQNAENPMLYKYNINLECWNVRSAKRLLSGAGIDNVDRFGPGGDLAGTNTLTSLSDNTVINALSSIGDFL